MDSYTRKIVEVKKIVDGDTVDLVVDLGYTITITDRFRMEGYDAPETYRPKSEAEKEAGLKVKEKLETLLSNADQLYVKSSKTGKYGRYLATIYSVQPIGGDFKTTDINQEIIEFMADNALTKEDIG